MSELYFWGIPERAPARPVHLTRSAGPAVLSSIKPFKLARIALAGGDDGDFTFNWQNPESEAIMITQCAVQITVEGAGGSTLDVGPAAASGTTSALLLEEVALDATGPPYWYDSFTDQNNVSLTCAYLDAAGGATDWVTGNILDANAPSLAGYCYLFYMLLG